MTTSRKNAILALAALLGVASLPMKWLTLHGARFDGPMAEILNAQLGELTIDVTRLEGRLGSVVELPLWSVAAVAIAAAAVQILGSFRAFSVPKVVTLGTALVAIVLTSGFVVVPAFTDRTTTGVGALAAFASAAIPLICLTIPTTIGTVAISGAEPANG